METIVGSPRSSSGYGSSEEDHGCFGLAAIRSTSSSTPQTPESLSPLPSDPFGSDVNVDLQSVFEDDDMPDFSDLGTMPDANELYNLADDWSAVTTPQTIDGPDSASLLDFIAEDIDHVTQFLSIREGNILASLLKQKSDLDWTPTTPSSIAGDISADSPSTADCAVASRTSLVVQSPDCEPETAQSLTSPLQRLKALTQGSVVNNTELPVRPRIIINNSSGTSAMNAVIRVGAVGASPTSAAGRSNRTLASGKTSYVSSSTSAEQSTARPPFFTVTSTELTSCSPSYPETRPRKQLTPSATAPTRSTSVAIRRTRSELDDHRYSSLLPVPMTSSSSAVRRPNNSSGGGVAKRANRSASAVYGGSGASSFGRGTGPRKTGSSMLETLLLTNRTLRPNEGSEASLAACGVWSSCRGSSSIDDGEHMSVGGPQAKRTCSEAPGSLLEHLLTGRTDVNSSPSASISKAVIIKNEPIEEEDVVDEVKLTAADGFGLFNEHLLYDESQGINLGGLFGEEMSSTWTPACFDDRVSSFVR